MAYLDTSVLGSYFCPESLTVTVRRRLAPISDPAISLLSRVEFCSLLSRKVRISELDRETASAIHDQFKLQLAEGRFRIIEIGSREYEMAGDWLIAFNTGLRAADALHLATAYANREMLLTTDKVLADAARTLHVSCELIH